jgi:hypothetical protein
MPLRTLEPNLISQVKFEHEFLLIRVEHPRQDGTMFWIRLERSTREATRPVGFLRQVLRTASSVTEAKDSVKICVDRYALFSIRGRQHAPNSLVRISYHESDAPRLRDLCLLLSFISDASPDYKLLAEQCYWLCSSIIEIMRGVFPGAAFSQDPAYCSRGKYGTFAAPQAEAKQHEIRCRFADSLAQRCKRLLRYQDRLL